MSARRERIIQTMKKAGLDAVLYAAGANFQYVSECTKLFWQRSHMNNMFDRQTSRILPEAIIWLDTEGDCRIIAIPRLKDMFPGQEVIVSYTDQMPDTLSFFFKGKKIGIGFDCHEWLTNTVHEIDPEAEVIDAELLLKDLRKIKDEGEIEKLRALARFTDEAIMWVSRHFTEGMTIAEAENMLMEYCIGHGIEDFSFPPLIGFKTQGTFTEEQNFDFPRTNRLLQNTGIAFDIGFVKDGYCSDWGRTFYWGKAPELIRNGYQVLQEAQVSMIRNIIPYKTNVNETYRMVTDYVNAHGYGPYFRVQFKGINGHQIGIDCHEYPLLMETEDEPFVPGMVFCSEPKMIFTGEMYMRVEDMILITENGAESLTKFPRDLFEIGG